MNRIATSFLLGAALLLTTGCFTARPAPPIAVRDQEAGITLTEANANSSISVQRGETIVVRLLDNGTSTGYRWEDRTGIAGTLAKVGTPRLSRVEAPDGAVGVPGALTQTYVARHPGNQDIEWARIPPGRDAAEETLKFRVLVK